MSDEWRDEPITKGEMADIIERTADIIERNLDKSQTHLNSVYASFEALKNRSVLGQTTRLMESFVVDIMASIVKDLRGENTPLDENPSIKE